MNHFAALESADYLIVESTYGNRDHEDKHERKHKLERAIRTSIMRGGTLMIPSFAIERTQEILFELNDIVESKKIPHTPVFLDSPMAIEATHVYRKYRSWFNHQAEQRIKSGDDLFDFPGLVMTRSVEESKAINNVSPPKIIIAGSGMSTGGRILHHELRYLSDSRSTLLIIGYQVAGTLGRRILDGETEVTIWGEHVPVRAGIVAIGGYSAHADQRLLLTWIGGLRVPPKRIFVTHGEKKSAETLKGRIETEFGYSATVPSPHWTAELT
jgi:metallo-beta-lactamase family protein